jgi:ATP-dependent helicase/nuclease subunit A
MDKNFNETDASDSVLWHENIGIGMDFVDTMLRVKYPSITKQLIREVKIKDSRAEEMRLLYVALTRL